MLPAAACGSGCLRGRGICCGALFGDRIFFAREGGAEEQVLSVLQAVLAVLRVPALALPEGPVLLEGEDSRHDAVEEVPVVGDDDDDAGEVVEIVLEHLESLDIEIVRRLIEDQDIRGAHQDLEKAEPALLPAGELPDERVLHFRVEEKALAHDGGRRQPVLRADVLRRVADEVDDARALVEGLIFLTEVPDFYGLSDLDGAGVGLYETDDAFKERRFSAAVRADDADAVGL